MGVRLSEITLGQLADGAGRYKPAALTVAALVTIATVLGDSPVRRELASPAATTPLLSAPATSGRTAAPVVAPEPVVEESRGFDYSAVPTFDAVTPSFASDESVTIVESGVQSGSSFDTGTTEPAAAPEPLAIVATAWASASAGTPLAGYGVPPDSLPVGTRLNRTDKASFVRLTGDERLLTLTTWPAGARAEASGKVSACAITTPDWAEGDAQSFSAAAKWDAEACVAGTRSDDGSSWSFDLDGIDLTHGVALVPGPGAPIDFQVAFSRAAS